MAAETMRLVLCPDIHCPREGALKGVGHELAAVHAYFIGHHQAVVSHRGNQAERPAGEYGRKQPRGLAARGGLQRVHDAQLKRAANQFLVEPRELVALLDEIEQLVIRDGAIEAHRRK